MYIIQDNTTVTFLEVTGKDPGSVKMEHAMKSFIS